MATTVAEILATASRPPDRIALIMGDRKLSHGGLDRAADRVAEGLVGLGVGPGDRVSLFGANSPEWIAAYDGVAKAGAVAHPLSSMLTRRLHTGDIATMDEDGNATIVIARRT